MSGDDHGTTGELDPWQRWVVETIQSDPDGPVANDLREVVRRIQEWWATVPEPTKAWLREASR